MSRTPSESQSPNRIAQLLAFNAVLIAGLLAYLITLNFNQNATAEQVPPAQTINSELMLLQQQPTLGSQGTRYDVLVDFECPYCDQFLSSPAFNEIHQQAQDGHAQLNVTAVAFLNERSTIKGSAYNCIAEIAGPATALTLIPELKNPISTNPAEALDHILELGTQHVNEADLTTCMEEGYALERAATAMQTAGARGVPTVYVDGNSIPWTEVQPN